jgi:hypothetical protein
MKRTDSARAHTCKLPWGLNKILSGEYRARQLDG